MLSLPFLVLPAQSLAWNGGDFRVKYFCVLTFLQGILLLSYKIFRHRICVLFNCVFEQCYLQNKIESSKKKFKTKQIHKRDPGA